jgi:uncharacterized protein YjdB
MKHFKRTLLSVFLSLILINLSFSDQTVSAKTSISFDFVILSDYSLTADIGDEFYIAAVTSTLSLPTWKSSNSSVASVNTYGKVTAKKAGTALITAKIKNAEASCRVTVKKTIVTISKVSNSIERGETLKLTASTSNNSAVTWKSSKKSVATIDEYGIITGVKPGETTITATADKTSVTCKVTVKSPTIELSQTKIKLYRGQSFHITASVSSAVNPEWKTNKKSVAVVDEDGTITAVKHGTAMITATVDGVFKNCEVIVEQPIITLKPTELNLKKGNTATINAAVSSGNSPIWSSSNSNVAIVDSAGKVTALQKGRAYIYAAEDGVKVRCTINVTE